MVQSYLVHYCWPTTVPSSRRLLDNISKRRDLITAQRQVVHTTEYDPLVHLSPWRVLQAVRRFRRRAQNIDVAKPILGQGEVDILDGMLNNHGGSVMTRIEALLHVR